MINFLQPGMILILTGIFVLLIPERLINLRRGLLAKRGSFWAMFNGRPIAITIAVITILMLIYTAYGELKNSKKAKLED